MAEKVGTLYVEINAKIDSLDKGLKQINTSLVKVSKKTDKLGKTLDKGLTPATKRFGASMSKATKQLVTGFIGSMGAIWAISKFKSAISSTIRAGREFEREWANVTTMLSISKRETAKLRQELVNLSPTLGKTTDLARGMYQVLSASIEPAKAVMFLGEAAKAAQAGVTTTAVAVDALTTVINAYGMEAEDVTKVSDVMFQTVKRGKLTYEQMANALGTVVPIASAVGVRFEEVAAAMSTLTRQGIDANTATMQVRQVLNSILSPGAEAAKVANKIGLEFNATALRAKGLVKFLQEVR